MRLGAALAALLLLPARAASAEVLDGWPCPGCTTVVPPAHPTGADGGAATGPRPLLVVLHGDGGLVRPVVRAWKAAAEAAGVIVLAPLCPRALGCPAGSFWQWLASSGHDPAWLGAQIDAVEARFEVDARRVYATGYSGGATYLGWYAPVHATRFGAVAHVAGGAPYRPPCPACKLPVLFVLGASDPMIGPYTRPLRQYYETCEGHEIAWETLPGVSHESILQVLEGGRARSILAWLLARPAGCAEPGVFDAGVSDAGPTQVGPTQVGPTQVGPTQVGAPAPPQGPPAAGCACGPGRAPGPAGGMAALGSLGGLFLLGRKRDFAQRAQRTAKHSSRALRFFAVFARNSLACRHGRPRGERSRTPRQVLLILPAMAKAISRACR